MAARSHCVEGAHCLPPRLKSVGSSLSLAAAEVAVHNFLKTFMLSATRGSKHKGRGLLQRSFSLCARTSLGAAAVGGTDDVSAVTFQIIIGNSLSCDTTACSRAHLRIPTRGISADRLARWLHAICRADGLTLSHHRSVAAGVSYRKMATRIEAQLIWRPCMSDCI